MRTIIKWTSDNGANGPDELERELDLAVIPRIGEELHLCFYSVPPHLARTSVTMVRWVMDAITGGQLVPEIYIEDRMGLEVGEMEGLKALGWKKMV